MRFWTFLPFLVTACVAHASETTDSRLLRFPDIYKDQVTFVYAGDIYITSLESDQPATRLTAHQGRELFPKFSPDGQQIAFSAEFSGNRQVYIMNIDGTGLTQLTYYNDVGEMPPRGGFDYRVLDWTPDGKHVLVRANRLPWGKRMGRPYLVPVDAGMEQPLAVPETGGGMLSPDGNHYIYTPIDREFRTWKHYRGGRAQDVWTYDLKQNRSRQLTTHPATDQHPLWVGDDIFFVSDRDYTLNLYQYQEGQTPVKQTHHNNYDVLWPSAGPESIVYENGGYLYRYQPTTGAATQLHISVQGGAGSTAPQFKSVVANIESMDIAPDGKRALFTARGELFTVPAKHGAIRNISRTPTHRELDGSWSPDGKQIAYLSDASGEYEIYIKSQDGSSKAKQLTHNGTIWRFAPVWSPDSSKLMFADKDHTLWVLWVKSGKLQKVDRAEYEPLLEYTWAPDSKWLAYTKQDRNRLSSVWVYNLASKAKPQQLTSHKSNDTQPVFDPKGRYLYFLSDRDFNLTFSSFERNYLYEKSTRVYAGMLTNDTPALFPVLSDETGSTEPEAPAEAHFTIEVDGFTDRVVALDAPAGSYHHISANEQNVFVLNSNALLSLNLEKHAKPEAVADGISRYALSADGKKLLLKKGSNYAIVDAKPKQNVAKSTLALERMQLKITPKQEWAQIYKDAWRIFRDWFYDPNIHGTDWQAIQAKYQPMADAVTSRADLDYVLGEVGGELNAGHVYVQSGDQPRVKRIDTGLLGADIVATPSGYFKIRNIMPGENWHEDFRSPLTVTGVKAAQGNYILAVNGVDTRSVGNFYQLMENTLGTQVTLTLNTKPTQKGSWKVRISPIKQETNLRYLQWVQQRAEKVAELSGGRIGYIHLPNTAFEGNRELFKHWIYQVDKDALIIDDRYNGGGFIPDRMMEILSRKTQNYWKWRGLKPEPSPMYAHDGPKTMLVNGYSSSGGDALPFLFKKLNLGKVIGTRTWGGLIGISYNPSLVDGGQVIPANFRILDTEGNWVVENVGVSPDIEVIDRPEQVAMGQDPSLEAAVKLLMKDLQANPRKQVNVPAAPSDFRNQ